MSAEAEVVQIGLDPSADTFLVLATDGVWDQLSSGDAVALVADTVKQPTMCAQVRGCSWPLGSSLPFLL